jgi:two-component system, chemotaxis family, CheB/CheR fusion protein
MPRSAIAAGCIDFVLSPEEIAKELARIARHPHVRSGPAGEPISTSDLEEGVPKSGRLSRKIPGASEDPFHKILVLLRNSTGVDFSLYKPSTIERRIGRRMVLSKLKSFGAYLRYLRRNANEVEALYRDMLISVTGFFRNPEAFEVLKKTVFPKLLKGRSPDHSIRVWVLGCSTGQEAYSIVMSFLEFMSTISCNVSLQVFATDLNDVLVEKARAGLYARSLVSDVSAERLRRFFVEEDGGYRISKAIREMCVFAKQNILSDAPFSRMDLISCRNLLIYLEPGSHRKIVPTFHYALKSNGFLFLGASETIGANTDLFAPVDKKQRLYVKKAGAARALNLPLPVNYPVRGKLEPSKAPMTPRNGFELEAQREADRATLNKYGPAGVLVNDDLDILQFRGVTSRDLAPAPGRASLNLLKMAREGLFLPLRSALNKARKENQRIRKENIKVDQNGQTTIVHVEVIPLKNLKERCFLILFEPVDHMRRAAITAGVKHRSKRERGDETANQDHADEVLDLKREVGEMRDYVQSVLEEHEAANEELQASNEEVQSANEELQSINEELETSKEELESTNEELITVNEEVQRRNQELNRLNDELKNLHSSANLSIVVLGNDLTIRRFTAAAEKDLNLLASDLGQPISRIKTNLDFPGLEKMISEAITTAAVSEKEVESKDGRSYSLRIRPFLTADSKIDGAVMVLVDITNLKQVEQRVREERNYAQAIVRTMPNPLVVLNGNLSVKTASRSFYRNFEVTPKQTEGRLIYELGNGQWDIPALRTLLEEVLPKKSYFVDYEVMHHFESIGQRTMLLSANRIDSGEDVPGLILLNIEDITGRKRAEAALRQSEERFRTTMNNVAEGLYTVDTLGLVTYLNPAAEKMLGWTGAELLGRKMHDLTHFQHPDGSPFPASDCAGLRVLEQGTELREHEDVFIRKDGSFFPVVFSASAIESGDATMGLVVAFRDDTEHKKAESELRELMSRESRARSEAERANRVKDEFLAMVSHELRTPLNAIIGWAQIMKKRNLSEEDSERAILSINRNAKAQATIISELLDVAGIITGKLRLDRRPTDIANVINAAIDIVRPLADSKGVEITSSFDTESQIVLGEYVRLQQVIWNLLDNAIKFTPKGGAVDVRLQSLGDKAEVMIRDTGEGIVPEFLPHIFERFQQADTSARRPHGGLGLGLSIARKLVNLHSGDIQATSEGRNKGTTFTITLPLVEKSKVADPVLPSPVKYRESPFRTSTDRGRRPAESTILTDLKVLVVDDQDDHRELLTVALISYGAEIRACTSAAEAVKVLPVWRPDVIVSDIGMPGEDGYEMIKKMRALNAKLGGETPAVALTGYASSEDVSRALAAGYQVHLSKPVELEELSDAIAKLAKDRKPDAAGKTS